jgi:CBS domain containing-hemolysin-like protein
MEILIPILIIILLIVVNGVFVASEFGIVGAPKTAIEREAAKGSRSARRVAWVLDDWRRQDRYIATAQLGITFASLGLGMYGEHVVAEWIHALLTTAGWDRLPFAAAVLSHTVASALAIGVLTYFHIVIGEMIPKSIALMRPQVTAKGVTPLILFLQYAFFPLVYLLNATGNMVLRRFGVRRREVNVDRYRTPEELAYIVLESQKGGYLKKEAAEVFQELLEFGDLTAAEAMVPRTMITGIPSSATDAQIHRILREQPHSRYPIYTDSLDQIIGMVHVKDLLRCLPECAPKLPNIVRPLPFVPSSASLEDVLKTMIQVRTQLAIVMDEQGGVAGLLTIEDLFEEIVGEIREDMTDKPEIYKDRLGRLKVAGTVRVENVGEELGMVLEHDEVDTVSGLVLAALGRPAEVEDVVEYRGVRFTVASVKGRGVRECLVEVMPKAEAFDDEEEDG